LITCFSVAAPASIGVPLASIGDNGTVLSQGNWLIEIVEDEKFTVGAVALRVSQDDFPNLIYYPNLDDLLFGKRNETDWAKELVEPAGFVQMSQGLAVNASSEPHICFTKVVGSDSVLQHATPSGSGWDIDTVDSTTAAGQLCSIAVDEEDGLHISYPDLQTGTLRYAFNDGSSWTSEPVDMSPRTGGASSIAIDTAGRPAIAYEDLQNGTIRYAIKDGGEWKTEHINEKYNKSNWPSLDFSSDGEPHIAYSHTYGLKHAFWNLTKWESEEAGPLDGRVPTLRMSSNGDAHLIYWLYSGIVYAHKSGDEWTGEEIMKVKRTGLSTSLDLDSNDLPHCAFIDEDNGFVYYATKANFSTSQPPIADAGGPYEANEGEPITFDASASQGPDGGSLQYRWDFNDDGLWDTAFSDQAIAVHTWNDDYSGNALVEVRTTSGPDAIKIIGDRLPGGGFVVGQEKRAQSFVATFDKASNISLDVSLNRNDVPNAPLVLALRSELNGPDLTSAQVDGTGMPVDTENWVDFDFPDIALIPGGSYYVVLYSNATNQAGYQPHVTYDAYSNGTAWGIGPGGIWEESPALDIRMMIFGGGAIIYASDTASVSVYNVAPSANVDGPFEGDEPHTIQFTGTFTDPGTLDTHTFQWDFDYDGITFNVDSTQQNPTHQWLDDFNGSVAFKVTDDDGGWDMDITHVTVNNLPPNATANGPYNSFEGSPVQFTGNHTDPGPLDTHTYEWDFSYDGTTFNPDATGNPYQKTWWDDHTGNIALRVTDDDGGWGLDVTTVTIVNVPPIADAGDDKEGYEVSTFTFNGSFYDPGAGDTHTFEWDFDYDGTTFNADSTGQTATHTWADDFDGLIALRVTDDDGGSDIDTAHVLVKNVAPTVTLEVLPIEVNAFLRIAGEKWHDVSIELFEDGVLIANGTLVRYPGSPDDQMLDLSGIQFDYSKQYSATVTYTPEDDPINGQPQGANPCWIILNFSEGQELWIHHTFNVNHPDSYVWEVDLTAAILSHGMTFEATAFDPGADDLTFYWDFGDGTNSTSFHSNANGTYPVQILMVINHAFPGSGTYVVVLTVEDDDGGVGTASLTIVIP
jgi:hypothetical protein